MALKNFVPGKKEPAPKEETPVRRPGREAHSPVFTKSHDEPLPGLQPRTAPPSG